MQARLSADGELSFTEFTQATGYKVQWADAPDGPWQAFPGSHQSLNALAADSSRSVVVPLEASRMFFRVAAVSGATHDAFARLEAESHDAMSGIQFEPGNRAIGWFDDGDWLMLENIDFGDGAASLTISAAKANTGGTVELRLNSPHGTLLGEFVPQTTGGWSDYVEQQLNLEAYRGVHDLYLVARGATGVANSDWLRFSTEPIHVPDYQLVWEDNFDGDSLDTGKWHPVQHGDVDNGEVQFYTDRPDNIHLADGFLWLTARRETYTGSGPWMDGDKTTEYTSGKVQGDGKISFQYGRIEARIRMPRGEGLWPAFWMLGENIFEPGVGWPKCGEIDIMEHANVQDWIGAAIHTEAYNHTIGTQKTGSIPSSDYDTEFHTYGVEWTADRLSFYLDDSVYFTVTKSQLGDSEAEWPFDQPFWLILNLAVGGAWGGDPSNGQFPQSMQVDWVRVYQDAAD